VSDHKQAQPIKHWVCASLCSDAAAHSHTLQEALWVARDCPGMHACELMQPGRGPGGRCMHGVFGACLGGKAPDTTSLLRSSLQLC
jgi:hypothetical protein